MLDVFVSEPFDLETLIAMKNEAGRDKDLDDIKHLRMIQDGQ